MSKTKINLNGKEYEAYQIQEGMMSEVLFDLVPGSSVNIGDWLIICGNYHYPICSKTFCKLFAEKIEDSVAHDEKYIKTIIENLKNKYKYKPLPATESEKVREIYKNSLKISDEDKDKTLYTKSGKLLSGGFMCIVVGDYGAFIEISPEQIMTSSLQQIELWRTEPKYSHVKYLAYTHKDDNSVYIYKQKSKVAYADYKPNMYYISPFEVIVE